MLRYRSDEKLSLGLCYCCYRADVAAGENLLSEPRASSMLDTRDYGINYLKLAQIAAVECTRLEVCSLPQCASE